MSGNGAPDAQPGGRAPAPPPLAALQDFLNTADLEEGHDDLVDTEGLGSWLAARGLADADLSIREGDRRRLVGLREALRDVIDGRDHGGIDAAALLVVAEAAHDAVVRVTLEPDGAATLTPASSGLDGFVARLMADIAAAQLEGTWGRLKVCPRDVCRWAFYDGSKNRSGRWCTMRICGSRTKSARLRSRQRRRPGATRPSTSP
jgi:predicted RNA-binding Zn ribbon-like protein